MRPRGKRTVADVKKTIGFVVLLLCLPIMLMAVWSVAMGWPDNWRTADWSSARIAPDPASNREAIIQVYAARAGRWKGVFSVHTWIVFKPRNATGYTRYDVVGWGTPVRKNGYPVDGFWYSNAPEVVHEIRGEAAQSLIANIEGAVGSYPFGERGFYRAWPGPNSNTFVAWIARQVPGLGLEMPANAVGKDYLGNGLNVSKTPSGTGWQVSAWGLMGVAVAWREGIEFHFLGATIGVDIDDAAIKLPGIGSLGWT
jgi:hypothetical protein